MTKQELRKTLIHIKKRYIELEPCGGDGINEFVDCLDNENLREHLLKTELCSCESELVEMLPLYSTAKGIIQEFEDMHDILCYWDMMKKKDVPRLNLV